MCLASVCVAGGGVDYRFQAKGFTLCSKVGLRFRVKNACERLGFRVALATKMLQLKNFI